VIVDIDRIAGLTRTELLQACRQLHDRALAAELRARELVAELELLRYRQGPPVGVDPNDPNPSDDPNLYPSRKRCPENMRGFQCVHADGHGGPHRVTLARGSGTDSFSWPRSEAPK